jgi:predicted ArsR family transcriptional regulator
VYENTSRPATGADALRNPVRAAIVSRLLASEEASLDELAEHADVHRNTVRTHVAALEARGILERARPAHRSGRGRPQTRYRLADGIDHPLADFRGISRLLSDALSASGVNDQTACRLGRELARANVRRRARAAWRSQLQRALGLFGFDARVDEDAVLLRRCPCPAASPASPELVCSLVSGYVDGALEGLGTTRRVSHPDSDHDPVRRRCVLPLVQRRTP